MQIEMQQEEKCSPCLVFMVPTAALPCYSVSVFVLLLVEGTMSQQFLTVSSICFLKTT
jgi:hypothetical protein